MKPAYIKRTGDDRCFRDVFATCEIVDQSHVFERKTEVRLLNF